MKITYDDVADIVGFELSEEPATRTREQGNGVLVGYGRKDKVVSVQVLDASKQFDSETLALLQPPTTPLTLAEAARESGLAAGTLRVLLNSGRLQGEKRGRDWTVTAAELDTYLESRAPAGRPAFKYKARVRRPMLTSESGAGGFLQRAPLRSNALAPQVNPDLQADSKPEGRTKGPRRRKAVTTAHKKK
jgi:uncharacterized protein YuzE